MITCIDYFAGIGAWELAAEILEQIYSYQVFTTYQFVEILPSAQQVLRSH
jgi:site-specific DNA-cytosine methylase